MKFGFVGAGKVGFSLGKYLELNDIDLCGYYSKSYESAYKAGEFTNSKAFSSIDELVRCSDVIFITVEDTNISIIWDRLKELDIKSKIFCHCSGSMSSKVFQGIKECGAYGYSIHPMAAISNKSIGYKNLREAFITIEGDYKFLSYFEELFKSFGNKVKIISSDNKSIYHGASVIASNFLLAIINKSIYYLKQCGFEEEESMDALLPLIKGSISNLEKRSIIQGLTGPIERGDLKIIKSHLDNINEEDKSFYVFLSKELLSMARRKNNERSYDEIEAYLEGFYEKYSDNIQRI